MGRGMKVRCTRAPSLVENRRAGDEPRLCVFIPTLTAGGAERVASILANTWCLTRRVAVVTYFDEPHFYQLDPRVDAYCLGMSPNRGVAQRSVDILLAAGVLRCVVRRMRPDFVLSFMNKYNAFCLAALAGTDISVIVSERDSPTEVLPRLRVIARDILYPYSAGLICQTDAGHAFMTERLSIKYATTIPNPVIRILDPTDRVPEPVILSVGRLTAKKAQDQLIAAFAAMNVQGWRLVLCGDGPLREALECQVSELGIADRVEFAGTVHDLRPYFRRAGIFAFSSLYEGYPNALAEAMVSGLPCVSYDCPTGPADLIADGENGLLVPLADVAALTAALDRLAGDAAFARRLGAEAARLAEELAPEGIAARYLSFCEDAARAKAAG